jgi:hypothetical protein
LDEVVDEGIDVVDDEHAGRGARICHVLSLPSSRGNKRSILRLHSLFVAPPKRKTGGRVTPKGTKPGGVHQTHHLDHADPKSMHGVNTPDASTRYTPPTPKSYYASPSWVPILMFALLILGSLIILLYYLGAVPGGRSNWYLLGGLVCVLGGLYTATKYK